MRFVHFVPATILQAPERIFLKFACILIGIGILIGYFAKPPTAIGELPLFAVIELAAAFIIGGAATLYGIIKPHRHAERIGLACTAYAAASYAIVVVLLAGVRAVPPAIIFAGLASACIVRLVVGAATRHVFDEIRDLDAWKEDDL